MYRQGLAAAARLRGGIGLGALKGDHQKKEMMMRKISSSFSDDQFFIRRRKYSSSSAAAAAAAASMETKEDSLKGKYLHLCFCEHVEPSDLCTRDVVRSIKLSDLLSSTTTKDDEDDAVNQIEQEAYNKSTGTLGNPLPWAYCRLGSQILFARGSTSRVLRMRFQLEEPVRGKILTFDATSGLTFKTPNFTLPRKHHRQFPTALLEVDRKLYCLDTRSQQYYSTSSAGDRFLRRRYPEESPPAFAVLDPAVSSQGEGEWLPLESPPPGILYHDDNFQKLNKLMYCTVEGGGESEGSKILVWNPDKAGVCYFDVSQPKKGWIELHSPLATSLPFVKGCWGDTANLNHPQGTLIFTHQSDFTYYGTRTPDQSNNISVQVLLMSHNLDSLQALKPPLQLDQIIPIPPEFLNDRSLGSANGLTESCLVHLGGQKVCLILHKYFYSLFFTDEIGEELFDDSGRNKGILRLITFEYEVTPNLDIQCRFLTARNFEYYTKLPNNEYGTHTALASLTKAFVM